MRVGDFALKKCFGIFGKQEHFLKSETRNEKADAEKTNLRFAQP